jgi:choline dehydrogenase
VYEGFLKPRKKFKAIKIPGATLIEHVPGIGFKTEAQIKQVIKDRAFGHHAVSSCPIGADDDKMAVLDSRFRIRGT